MKRWQSPTVHCKCSSECTTLTRAPGCRGAKGYARGHNPGSHSLAMRTNVSNSLRSNKSFVKSLVKKNKSQRMRRLVSIYWKNKYKSDAAFRKRKISVLVRRNKSKRMRRLVSQAFRKAILNGTRSCATWKARHVRSVKGGRMLCRSSWESSFVQFLDNSRLVKSFSYERIRIPYFYSGNWRVYIPDFLVKFKDGVQVLVELKGYCRDKQQLKAKLKAVRKYAKRKSMDFLLIRAKLAHRILENQFRNLIKGETL